MKPTSIEINGKLVGQGQPTFIIAEAGSNHNGSLQTAIKLIEVAADAEADAIKFQTFTAEKLYSRKAGVSGYLGSEVPIFEIIKSMEMPVDWLHMLRDRAHALGLAFLSTPFHEEAVHALMPFVDAFKIASYELTHTPLMNTVAQCRKPILISTGAATLPEVRDAVQALRRQSCEAVIVLQCTAAYPAPLDSANVRVVQTLAKDLNVLTGLSDHTRDPIVAPMVATAFGAVVIEKHFTLSNRLPGPDHAFAVEPHELRELVQAVRRTEAVVGSGEKTVQAVENELRQFARRSICSTKKINKGEAFSRENIDILRHGNLKPGLAPRDLSRVLDSAAANDIDADTPVSERDLTPRL